MKTTRLATTTHTIVASSRRSYFVRDAGVEAQAEAR